MPVAQASAPSFETVWALVKEVAENLKETDRIIKESQQETDRVIKESQQEVAKRQEETDRQIEKTSRKIEILTDQMGGLHNKFGEIAEHLVGPGIVERFNNLGYHFDGIADRGFKILDEKRNLKTEIDILLENGDFILVVEVDRKSVV